MVRDITRRRAPSRAHSVRLVMYAAARPRLPALTNSIPTSAVVLSAKFGPLISTKRLFVTQVITAQLIHSS